MDPCLACHCPPPANRGGASATALTVATIPRRVRRTIVEELPGWARSSGMVVSVTLEEMDAPSCVRVFRLVLTRFGGHLDVSTRAGQDHCRHRCRRPRGCHRLLHRTPYGAGGQGTSRDLGWIGVVGLDDARVEITPDGQDD